jgi:hypothetical protein
MPFESRNATAVSAALSDLTRYVYDCHVSSFLHPRQFATHNHLNDPMGGGRAAAIGLFKHLKHFAVEWLPLEVERWAGQHGWLENDRELLREFAVGVQAGTRFHTMPQPWARPQVESWLTGTPMSEAVGRDFKFRMRRCCEGDFRSPPSQVISRAVFTRR